jgi:hypothetical protein
VYATKITRKTLRAHKLPNKKEIEKTKIRFMPKKKYLMKDREKNTL